MMLIGCIRNTRVFESPSSLNGKISGDVVGA